MAFRFYSSVDLDCHLKGLRSDLLSCMQLGAIGEKGA